MKQFSAEEIQVKYEALPEHIQDAVSSEEVKKSIEDIGKKYNLHIDQVGDLVDEIGLIMLGLKKPNNFVSEISSQLSIDASVSKNIANDLNTSVFSVLKQSMRAQEREKLSPEDNTISSLEKLGGFSIEKSEGNTNNENSTVTYEPVSDVSEADRQSILYGIENPVGTKVASTPNIQTKQEESTHTDPLIDHLLANPVSTTEKKVEQTAKPLDSQKPRGSDAYREPLN